MYWKVRRETLAEETAAERVDGRFVLHRHCDADGAHLDLRLEQDGYLLGWRIEGVSFEKEPWATEKAPHPPAWLERDGDAVREDAGVYAWIERGADRRELILRGGKGTCSVRFERECTLGPACVKAVRDALRLCGANPAEAGALIADGATARQRAIQRLCGLGRELDGPAFDSDAWKRLLKGLSLEEIQSHLRAFEVRFDQKYPPMPVSRAETLAEDSAEDVRAVAAFAIARE
ncbi:MAG TPA: hypothetical protein P5318_06415 [Candidatus Hydrogenedentes bacterium]|nr:hypothetical protein [Candidatus Hydrogenedentota bacterium]HPC15846.1 hypothetical protein [Candidatus Hydrogenedentota bacterium]HRT19745.1 hypothetical protein [Candidatus Hydrogenedentota bacterium]HRT64519.1 hypothetical protein [Candidatus Hydrogenedentota bacterium]